MTKGKYKKRMGLAVVEIWPTKREFPDSLGWYLTHFVRRDIYKVQGEMS